jgi:hypothetical protein
MWQRKQTERLRDTKRGGEEGAGKDKDENMMTIKYKKGSINLEGSRTKKTKGSEEQGLLLDRKDTERTGEE